MITRIHTVDELKRIWTEALLNKTDRVTKISDHSVVNGIAFGVAKIGQKAMKDVALIESHLFPDSAYGEHLDNVAENLGIPARFGASQSSVYVRVFAEVGTTYVASVHTFKGQGQDFEIVEDFTVGDDGYGYIKARSVQSGSNTNIPSLTINSVNPSPSGHQHVTNEYNATGGRDVESDEIFRIRIKNGANIGATKTLEYLTQVAIGINNDILSIFNYGVNDQNQSILGILTQNGVSLSSSEIDTLRNGIKEYLSLQDFNNITDASIGVDLRNIEYEPIDIEFRCSLIQNVQVDDVRRLIQIEISKYFDPRNWSPLQKIEWDDLLQIVKDNEGIEYVPDKYFIPRYDRRIRMDRLPIVRGFRMLDLDGNLIIDNGGIISPVYYPNNINQ